jgi:hypothetical protein
MFASTISEQVGRLTNLETFYIHDNFFEGTLPETLEQLSHLSEWGVGLPPSKEWRKISLLTPWSFHNQKTFKSVPIGFRELF